MWNGVTAKWYFPQRLDEIGWHKCIQQHPMKGHWLCQSLSHFFRDVIRMRLAPRNVSCLLQLHSIEFEFVIHIYVSNSIIWQWHTNGRKPSVQASVTHLSGLTAESFLSWICSEGFATWGDLSGVNRRLCSTVIWCGIPGLNFPV